ncbi:MAG: hypothetical protein ACKO2N_16735 [Tabrizicola sp.]
MLKSRGITSLALGALTFSLTLKEALSDQVTDYSSGSVLYGSIASMDSSGLTIDVACSGQSVSFSWSEELVAEFSQDCGAYRGWQGGDPTCGPALGDGSAWIPWPQTWMLSWRSEENSGSFENDIYYAQGFRFEPESGSIYFQDIDTEEDHILSVENVTVLLSNGFCDLP